MQSIRQHILEILKERGTATVAGLGRELGMAPVSVRHHLDVLQADGLIQSPGVYRKGRVGRPQQVYALTPAASLRFPNNFQELANGLLDELRIALQPVEIASLLHKVAAREAAQIPSPTADESMEQRLHRVSVFLTSKGYLPRWEKQEDGRYVLYALNCPYAGVSHEHHELCEMDQMLINQVLGVKTRLASRMAAGDSRCSYTLEVPADGPLEPSAT